MGEHTSVSIDENEFQQLKSEIETWVRGPGELWAERIEAENDVPRELYEELRDRGYLSLAAPVELGGRGIPLIDVNGTIIRGFSEEAILAALK